MEDINTKSCYIFYKCVSTQGSAYVVKLSDIFPNIEQTEKFRKETD